VERRFGLRHPLTWTATHVPCSLLSYNVDYPHPYRELEVPDRLLSYAVSRFRENLDLARSLEGEISDGQRIYMETTRPDDGDPPISYDSYGLTGPIAQLQSLMQRLTEVANDHARAELARWPVADHHIFARLRIWASSSILTSPSEAAEILLGFSDEVFWGSQHQRDLLYAIRDRWRDFSAEQRVHFEERLRTTSFPWSDDLSKDKVRLAAHRRLDRLHWLASQGVTFSFDLTTEVAALRSIATDWSKRAGQEAADSHAPKVQSVISEASPRVLDGLPVSEILGQARQASEADLFDSVERRPFSGLAMERPARALAALSDAARKGDVPAAFWSEFLGAARRERDSVRLVRAITGRLASLPPDALCSIAYPVATWLLALGDRLFDELAPILDRLWQPLIDALRLRNDSRKHRVDSSWANDALNAPVGKLIDVLMSDPAIKGLDSGRGFPKAWTAKIEQLLGLPGDMRPQVLVMLAYRINWMFALAPQWTEENVLAVVNDDGDDGNALWDGILWAARAPTRALYERLKPSLIARAMSRNSRRAEANLVGAFLLIGWGGDIEGERPKPLVSSAELREMLVEGNNDLRRQLLLHLQNWSQDAKGKWRARLVPFLTEVWPNHRALRTPEMSAYLSNLAMASGDLFPQVVDAILPRLVPLRGGMLRDMFIEPDAEDHPALHYPALMLDLLWAILAEDMSLWPYKVEEVLDLLAEVPETRADPRLSELRQRRSG
jgi:hypothetical protein